MRTLKTIIGTLVLSGIGLWAYVAYRHIDTVLELRRYGDIDLPLLHPLLFVPMVGFVLSAWLLAKNRLLAAATVGIPSLLLAIIYYVSQSAAGAGP